MKDIGAFRETYNSDKYPSIFDSVCADAPKNKAKILAYLKNGRETARAPGYFYDRISNGDAIIPAICYTDGSYEWRSDTIYYYERYNITLPEDFINHVLKKTS